MANQSVSVIPTINNLEEAKAFLSTCRRDELRDHAFGDAEVYWFLGDVEVGFGYYGSSSQTAGITDGMSFNGADATALRYLGTTGSIERNDETGPSSYQEGTILPGLTREAVLQEITRK